MLHTHTIIPSERNAINIMDTMHDLKKYREIVVKKKMIVTPFLHSPNE